MRLSAWGVYWGWRQAVADGRFVDVKGGRRQASGPTSHQHLHLVALSHLLQDRSDQVMSRRGL